MLHYRLITASPDWSTLPCVKLAISRTSGPILRGDVSEKRFNTHAMERKVAGVAQERLSDGTGCTDTWHCQVGTVTGNCYRIPAQGTITGYCHESLPQLNVTIAYKQRHPG